MRSRVYACAVLILFCTSSELLADKHPNTARGFDIGKPYQMNGIDNINMFNLNLTITIPIGQRYHVNGNLQYGLTLVYSGNAWDIGDQDAGQGIFTVYPNRRSNAGLGWLVSLGRLFPPNQAPVADSPFWNYETPDGALHAFHAALHDATITLPETCGQGGVHCYTRDSSYLRMTTNGADHTIEFPDGTMQVFREVQKAANGAWSDVAGTGIWRLREIKDRFANSVAITYSADAANGNPEIWTVADGIRTQKVYFNNGQTPAGLQSPYDALVDRIVLTTFGQTTAEWKLGYIYRTMKRGGTRSPANTTYQPDAYGNVPLLTTFTLPPIDGASQVYSMLDSASAPEYVVDNVNPNPLNGVITRLHLPTGGTLEWDHAEQAFVGSSGEAIKRTIGVTFRRLVANGHTDTWTYRRKESSGITCFDANTQQGHSGPPEQLVTSVTSPEQVTSVHYFSIYPDSAEDLCGGSGFPVNNYSLPITHGVSQTFGVSPTFAGVPAFLSQETYTGTPPALVTSPTQYRISGGTRVRSEWAAYELDTVWEGAPEVNSRESAHVTQYDDDAACTGCYTAISRFNFDGAGHFRQSSTRSNFAPDTAPAGNYVTSFTNYNQVDTSARAWLLNRFTEQCKVEDSAPRSAATACGDLATAVPVTNASILSGPHIEHFCFDSNGFLTRHRKLAASTPGANDLVTVYTGSSGNVIQEDYYGGDAQSVPTTNFCGASFTAPAYSIAHTYSYGSLATSKYPNLPAPVFLLTDNTIDANTGLVSFSRDATGLETAYRYDALGRVTKVTPPLPEVLTTYAYAETSTPFKVTAQRVSSSGTIQSITEFDAFGRPSKETETLPSTTTSRITTYTGSGWLNSVSQWEATPSHYTTYTYDPFGRPLTITAPDASVSTLQYSGVRTTSRTINMGITRSGTTVSQSPTTSTETYDAQGRLSNVHDAAGYDTSYGYDVSGHLTKVSMGVQTRLFTYDGRGLLTSEQHPELNGATGTVVYSGFDARGHADTKLLGSSLSDFDLAYTYDAAERLRQIEQITARSPLSKRVLKTFTFGTTGSDTAKLSQDARYNYRGSDVFKVTQVYMYRSSDGKLTSRDTTIDKNSMRLQKFTQSYDYTDVGALATLTYPTCSDPSRPCGASSLSSVSPTFSKGMVTSLPGFASSITYHDDGTVNRVEHPGSITDTYEADDHAMGRPKSIAFEYYDSCTPPTGVSISRTPTGTLTPQTTVQLTATVTGGYSAPIVYQWYRVVNGTAVPINGATASTFSEPVAATTTYRVRAGNGCGGRDSADVTVPVCSLAITAQPASQSSPPATLSVTATGCGTLSYQWYQISGNTNTPVGTNSATYNTGSLTATTTFWVRVTDSQNGASINSTNAVVTVNACQPQITENLQNQTVDYGTGVSVHITVSGCIGKTYHWFSGPSGDTSTPLWQGAFDGSPSITNVPLGHGPIWVRVDGDTITPVNSTTAMISVRPVQVHAAITVNTTNQITVTWQAIADHYLVKRCANGACDAPFTTSSWTSLNDVNRNLNTTYVYSIASVDAYGTASAYSNADIATTMSFTPVVSNGVIDRTHINELLTAVNLVRAANGSPPVTWSGILPPGVPAPPAAGQATSGIYAAHITSLRTQMNAALSAIGIPLTPYTDPQTLTVIKAVHFTDLQARIR